MVTVCLVPLKKKKRLVLGAAGTERVNMALSSLVDICPTGSLVCFPWGGQL